LLTRWHQLGVFTPIYRNHTMKGSRDQEPWVHGPEHEAIRKRYIELRYRLMPLIYTLAEESARTGLPMMRPLFLEYPNDKMTYGNDQQFLFGRDLLIAADLSETVDDYEFALPGGGWYDYWTGKRVQGRKVESTITTPEWVRAASPSVVTLAPRLEELPVFVRAGAIFAQQPVVQHTDEAPNGPLELRVYPGDDCSGSLYWDDGKTFDHKQGKFLRVKYSCSLTGGAAAGGALNVSISAREGSYTPWWSAMAVEIYGVERAPKEICATRGATAGEVTAQVCAPITGWTYHPDRHNVTFSLPENAGGWNIAIQ
jgi:alpha-glucosidase